MEPTRWVGMTATPPALGISPNPTDPEGRRREMLILKGETDVLQMQ